MKKVLLFLITIMFTFMVKAQVAAISGPTTMCNGDCIALTDVTTGGVWTSSIIAIATVDVTTGIVCAVSAGVVDITYTVGAFNAVHTLTVNPIPPLIVAPSTTCAGIDTTLYDPAPGGTWSSSSAGVCTIGSTGIFGGITAGVASISYTLSTGCSSFTYITVNPSPTPISGSHTVCVGSSIPLLDTTTGGSWTSSSTSSASIGSATGILTGVAVGTTTIHYFLGTGCSASYAITVNPTLTVSISYTSACGGYDSLVASSVPLTSYSWSPATGLSCPMCGNTFVNAAGVTTYTVTATNACGTATDTVSVNGNKIYGNITFGGVAPTSPSVLVWLIQYNPIDSSLTAMDSVLSCIGYGTPYYEFYNRPAGDYMLKAKLEGSVPGTSGYVPTYGYSNTHWDTATTITHTTLNNAQNINMIYGTVPSGPGFIGGLIVMGAGKNTSGEVPAPNILVYLEDTFNHVYTYTYTNTSGAYSFSGLGYGSYIVYPVDYKYHTTESSVITLSSSAPTDTAINFKKHTTLGTITPFTITTGISTLQISNFSVYPNPAKNILNLSWNGQRTGIVKVTVTDIVGNLVNQNVLNLDGTGISTINISGIQQGIYFISIKGEDFNYFDKIEVLK